MKIYENLKNLKKPFLAIVAIDAAENEPFKARQPDRRVKRNLGSNAAPGRARWPRLGLFSRTAKTPCSRRAVGLVRTSDGTNSKFITQNDEFYDQLQILWKWKLQNWLRHKNILFCKTHHENDWFCTLHQTVEKQRPNGGNFGHFSLFADFFHETLPFLL